MTGFLLTSLTLLLQSTGLLLLGLLALWLTRRRGPAIQTLIGRATLSSIALLLLLAPLSGHIRPVWRIPTPAQVPTLPKREGAEFQRRGNTQSRGVFNPQAAFAPSTTYGQGAASSTPTPQSFPTSTPPRPPETGGPLRSKEVGSFGKEVGSFGKEVGSLWLALTSLLLLWLALCQWHLTRLRRTASLMTSGPVLTLLNELTSNPPTLLTHSSVHSPFLAGYRHPVIFLSTSYDTDFETDALRAVFVHELAHRDRRDNLWTLAARLLTALLWPQPLLWLLVRRLEHISEDACDEAVLASACAPRAYADCLLSLATRPPLGRHQTTLTAGVAPFRSSIGRRISRILTTQGVRSVPPITLRLRLIATALSIAAALGGVSLISSAPAQTSAPMPFVPTAQELRHEAERKQDLQNVKVIGLALVMYERDHHYRFPDADHWMDQITPYLDQIALNGQDRSALYDPFQPGKKRYGYALNSSCSGKPLSAFSAPSETVAVFDSTKGTRNASDTGQSLRINASISSRINVIGSSYGFADGHAKWFRPEVHPSFALDGRVVTGSEPPANSSARTQMIMGYGLANYARSGKLYCRAIKNSVAFRLGVPANLFLEVVAVNGQSPPQSSTQFGEICRAAPPLRLLLKLPGQQPRLFILRAKGPFQVLTDAGEKDRERDEMQVLKKEIEKEQARLPIQQQSLMHSNQRLEAAVHQALPQGDALTEAKTINLERRIGVYSDGLQVTRETARQHPERHEKLRFIAQTEAALKLMYAEEARLFPATAQTRQQLAQIHILAVQWRARSIEVMGDKMQISILNQQMLASQKH